MRLEFSRKTRHEGDERCQGKCEICGMPFNGKRRNYHHIVEANDGGEATLANMLVICEPCHKPLTRAYVIELRKAQRVADKHTGAFLKSSRPLPGGRLSNLKIKMNGQIVRRDQTPHSSSLSLSPLSVKWQPRELPTPAEKGE